MDELLKSLRDVHLPPSPSWWPPAPGWWAVLLALALASAAAWWWWRYRRGAKPESAHDLAADAIVALRFRFRKDGDARRLFADLSVLMRRAAMSIAARDETAALTNEAWLAWLDQWMEGSPFTEGAGRILIEAPYRPEVGSSAEEVLRLCEAWIKTTAEAKRNRKTRQNKLGEAWIKTTAEAKRA